MKWKWKPMMTSPMINMFMIPMNMNSIPLSKRNQHSKDIKSAPQIKSVPKSIKTSKKLWKSLPLADLGQNSSMLSASGNSPPSTPS